MGTRNAYLFRAHSLSSSLVAGLLLLTAVIA